MFFSHQVFGDKIPLKYSSLNYIYTTFVHKDMWKLEVVILIHIVGCIQCKQYFNSAQFSGKEEIKSWLTKNLIRC